MQDPESNLPLCCVHVEGPDEFTACRDKAHAELVASQINDYAAKELAKGNPNTPHLKASVQTWPGDAASHAVDLARWEKESNH
jgi:hypothetical protein